MKPIRAVTLAFITFILVLIIFNRFSWKENNVFQWDQGGYYRYLPALFIYHDVADFRSYAVMNRTYGISANNDSFALHPQAFHQRRLNKYPVGVSLFECIPFFIAHMMSLHSNQYPPDGYSPYYRLLISLGAVLGVILGLWFTWNLLRRYYSEWVCAISIILILFGTNLYNYTVWDIGMSHPYSFFLLAALLYCTDSWYRRPERVYLLAIGFIYGLMLITRPTNAMALLFPLFWTIDGFPLFKDRLALFKTKIPSIALAILSCLLVCLIQMWYWKYATGHWIYYSYEKEGFEFKHPQILNGLFSFRKGWFIYTPMAFLIVAGIVPLYRAQRRQALLLLAYLFLMIFVVFSWGQWYYGGSFGSRVMIDTYPVLCLALAALIHQAFHSRKAIRYPILLLAILFLVLNLWQTYQFNIGIIPMDHNTAAYYKRVFFKLEKNQEDDRIFHDLNP